MLHLRTRLGTFWIAKAKGKPYQNKFILGLNQQDLGFYDSLEQAADLLPSQATGYLLWDQSNDLDLSITLKDWAVGPPKAWQESKH